MWFGYTQLLPKSDCFKLPNILILKNIFFKTSAIFVEYNIKVRFKTHNYIFLLWIAVYAKMYFMLFILFRKFSLLLLLLF